MFVCGHNGLAQLGLDDDEDRNTFTALPALPDGKVAKQVVAGGHHTMILAEDGTVFACGSNIYGQLGLGDTTDRNTFTAVPPLPDGKVAKQVVAGSHYTMILAENGTVFACGRNISGQLGLGNSTDRHIFIAVPALPDGKVAKQVLAGYSHTMILAEDGTVFGCGSNNNGQLGLGDTTRRNSFTAVPALPDGKVAKQVLADGYHTMVLAEDGTVFACGPKGDPWS
jgi:alpha-tubulin suppressor-like RCC1 family protein